MFDQDEPFCNPIAPVEIQSPTKSNATSTEIQRQNLSNEDFRKLMMTPSTKSASSSISFGLKAAASIRGNRRHMIVNEEFKKPESTSSADKKKNRKKYYQNKKEKDVDKEENILAELAKKYRDRAKERRENKDAQEENPLNTLGYNAVANLPPEDAAERRKQLIEESKYLGGDIEHTHLVKGLDYALLQKVKAEIEYERDQETLQLVESELLKKKDEDSDTEEQDWSIKSSLARNLMTILFENNLPEKNEYFLPGRLAYVFDLENDCPSDAFTAVIRSKTECPTWESLNTLSTSEIVLNKLIEIFKELREQGGRRKKRLKQQPIEKLEDKDGKFNFINQSSDFGTNNQSMSNSSIKESRSSMQNIETTNDLTSIYDQDLNVELIRKQQKMNVDNDLNIYDDVDDDYVMPHQRERSKYDRDRKETSDSFSRSSRHDDFGRSSSRFSKHSSSRDYRDYDRDYRRDRSSSKGRNYRNNSSSSDEQDRYRKKESYRKEKDSLKKYSRSPDYREDRHRSYQSSSTSKRRRY